MSSKNNPLETTDLFEFDFEYVLYDYFSFIVLAAVTDQRASTNIVGQEASLTQPTKPYKSIRNTFKSIGKT